MSVAKVVTAPEAIDKVVPLHHHFGHEEQVKNSDQDNVAITSGRTRKHPLPASDLAKVPTDRQTDLEQRIALIQQQLNALSPEEKAAVSAKLKTLLSKLQEQLVLLVKAMSGKSEDSPGIDSPGSDEPGNDGPTVFTVLGDSDGDIKYDPWNQSILMLYTDFAESQMNQNGQIMNGWAAQQQAQNQMLQEAASAEAENANKPTSSNQATWWKSFLVGLGVAVAVGLICLAVVATGGLALVAGGALAALSTGALVGIGAGISIGVGLAAGFGAYGNATANPDGGVATKGLVDSQPDNVLLQGISFSNQFWNTISQKTNNQISSGSQTNLVNASSNDTQIGQQAAQVIQALGQVMQTPVAH
jgi:hypothetical protein